MKRNQPVYRHSSPFYPAYPNEANANYFKRRRTEFIDRLFLGIGVTVLMIFLARLA